MKKETRKTSDNKHNRFKKVVDGKDKPIRGLWVRGRKYYAQMTITRPDGTKRETKVLLKAEDKKTAEATMVLDRLLSWRRSIGSN